MAEGGSQNVAHSMVCGLIGFLKMGSAAAGRIGWQLDWPVRPRVLYPGALQQHSQRCAEKQGQAWSDGSRAFRWRIPHVAASQPQAPP